MFSKWCHLLTEYRMRYDLDSFHHVTTNTLNKMADDDVYFRQGAVIEFLIKKQIPDAEIYQII